MNFKEEEIEQVWVPEPEKPPPKPDMSINDYKPKPTDYNWDSGFFSDQPCAIIAFVLIAVFCAIIWMLVQFSKAY